MACWLSSTGLSVYRPIDNGDAVDLLALDSTDGWQSSARIQVKTAYLDKRDHVLRCHTRHSKYTLDSFDILAVVFEQRIWFIPWADVYGVPTITMSSFAHHEVSQ